MVSGLATREEGEYVDWEEEEVKGAKEVEEDLEEK